MLNKYTQADNMDGDWVVIDNTPDQLDRDGDWVVIQDKKQGTFIKLMEDSIIYDIDTNRNSVESQNAAAIDIDIDIDIDLPVSSQGILIEKDTAPNLVGEPVDLTSSYKELFNALEQNRSLDNLLNALVKTLNELGMEITTNSKGQWSEKISAERQNINDAKHQR